MRPADQILIASIVAALRPEEDRAEAVRQLERAVGESRWEHRRDSLGPVLEGLTVDLAYYVADPVKRSEDRSYYGDERLRQILRTALRQVKECGLSE